MRLENGSPAFCNTCPDRGTCVGELSAEIIPTPTRNYQKTFYYSLRLQDRVHGRSKDMRPLESSWFNGMHNKTTHLERAGEILMDRVAACTGPNATGECVVVDVVGISTTVLEELMPEAAPVAELTSTHDS